MLNANMMALANQAGRGSFSAIGNALRVLGDRTEIKRSFTALTTAQIKALAATPVQVVADPGAGKFVVPLAWRVRVQHNGTAFDDAAADGNLILEHTGESVVLDTMEADGLIDAAATTQSFSLCITEWLDAEADIDGLGLTISNSGAEFTGASADSTAEVEVFYLELVTNPSE